jgi:hypothetical protein
LTEEFRFKKFLGGWALKGEALKCGVGVVERMCVCSGGVFRIDTRCREGGGRAEEERDPTRWVEWLGLVGFSLSISWQVAGWWTWLKLLGSRGEEGSVWRWVEPVVAGLSTRAGDTGQTQVTKKSTAMLAGRLSPLVVGLW